MYHNAASGLPADEYLDETAVLAAAPVQPSLQELVAIQSQVRSGSGVLSVEVHMSQWAWCLWVVAWSPSWLCVPVQCGCGPAVTDAHSSLWFVDRGLLWHLLVSFLAPRQVGTCHAMHAGSAQMGWQLSARTLDLEHSLASGRA